MIEINNRTRSKVDTKLVRIVTEKFFKHYKLGNKEVSIAFVGDITIKRLNKNYLHKSHATDVMAFPGDGKYFGEIIIDYAQVKRQAKKYSGSIKEELIFILVHGLLHLLGHEDKTKKGTAEMERLGKEFIKRVISKKT